MIKGKKIAVIGVFLPLFCTGQNLVPNPDFEISLNCAESPPVSTLENCEGWFNAVEVLSTVDWFSNCYQQDSPYLIPETIFGSSYPHSGVSMIGFAPYSSLTNKGEKFGVKLVEALKADSAYCISFWFKNSRKSGLDYTLYEFNMAFIGDTLGVSSPADIPSYLTVANNDETDDWNEITTYYIANGEEQFLLFGIFDPTPSYYIESHEPGVGKYMYYFIDDISVELCNKDSLLSVILELPNVFTPGDDAVNRLYTINYHNISSMDVQILNRWGNLIAHYDGLTEEWDGSIANGRKVDEGVYFIKIVAETVFGDVFEKQQFVHVYY
jgi:gliding motility-associated-like protein